MTEFYENFSEEEKDFIIKEFISWQKMGMNDEEALPDDVLEAVMELAISKEFASREDTAEMVYNAYKEFREARAKLKQEDKTINGLKLTKYLKNYASIGEKYVAILEDIIEKNSLTDFDKANLLPTKLKKGLTL